MSLESCEVILQLYSVSKHQLFFLIAFENVGEQYAAKSSENNNVTPASVDFRSLAFYSNAAFRRVFLQQTHGLSPLRYTICFGLPQSAQDEELFTYRSIHLESFLR
jgi:hypothetical protein